MACQHGTPYCFGGPRTTATFLAVTGPPDANGDLTQVHISGNKTKSVVSFLEEGLYILCGDRAVQIGAVYCELRACGRARICSCKDYNSLTDKIFPTSYNTRHLKNWTLIDGPQAFKPCNGCLYDWLNLQAVLECAQQHNFQLLRAPRTLFATLQMDRIVLAYDDKLSLDHVWDSFTSINLTLDFKQCPSHIPTWILETWHDFLGQNGYSSDNSSAASDESPEGENEFGWDDCDSPTHACSPGSPYADFDRIDNLGEEEFNATEAPEDGFDFFDDIIEAEFPNVYKEPTSYSNALRSDSIYEDSNPGAVSLHEHDDAPVSFVIPPKGMRLAQLL